MNSKNEPFFRQDHHFQRRFRRSSPVVHHLLDSEDSPLLFLPCWWPHPCWFPLLQTTTIFFVLNAYSGYRIRVIFRLNSSKSSNSNLSNLFFYFFKFISNFYSIYFKFISLVTPSQCYLSNHPLAWFFRFFFLERARDCSEPLHNFRMKQQ